jgi:type IV pilus assembly protein PilW
MRSQRGMTLVEMLVAMTVFLLVLGTTMGALQSQARAFQRGAGETAVLQNLRFGSELVDQDVRTAGANVPDAQPSIV